MDYALALALSLLQLSTCMAAPAPLEAGNVVKMKNKVKWMAEQLVVQLETSSNFRVPIGMTLETLDDELGGSASVVAVLDGYNSLISDSFGHVTQIKTEISSLTGYLDNWRQANCMEQRPKVPVPGPLLELQRRKKFIQTVAIEALMRVKTFLNLLLKNLDHLERC